MGVRHRRLARGSSLDRFLPSQGQKCLDAVFHGVYPLKNRIDNVLGRYLFSGKKISELCYAEGMKFHPIVLSRTMRCLKV